MASIFFSIGALPRGPEWPKTTRPLLPSSLRSAAPECLLSRQQVGCLVGQMDSSQTAGVGGLSGVFVLPVEVKGSLNEQANAVSPMAVQRQQYRAAG
jgi:hypothetical protein